jgi:hypothetical protein
MRSTFFFPDDTKKYFNIYIKENNLCKSNKFMKIRQTLFKFHCFYFMTMFLISEENKSNKI